MIPVLLLRGLHSPWGSLHRSRHPAETQAAKGEYQTSSCSRFAPGRLERWLRWRRRSSVLRGVSHAHTQLSVLDTDKAGTDGHHLGVDAAGCADGSVVVWDFDTRGVTRVWEKGHRCAPDPLSPWSTRLPCLHKEVAKSRLSCVLSGVLSGTLSWRCGFYARISTSASVKRGHSYIGSQLGGWDLAERGGVWAALVTAATA